MPLETPTVAALRRYPVKSMGGEALNSLTLDDRGVIGDRWWAVRDADGKLASGKNTRRFRRYDPVFDYAAETTPDGHVQVTDGTGCWRAGSDELDQALTRSFGAPVSVVQERDIPHHDDGAVSFIGSATLQWCRDRWAIDADPRRLRVNIVLDTDEPFIEETWIGQTVAIGSAELIVRERITRCRTVDLAQNQVPDTSPWLKHLGQERDLKIAMYADVTDPGSVSIGDTARVARPQPLSYTRT